MLKFEIIGNLGADAVVKDDNGRKYVQFSVADSRRYKRADGTDVEVTNWVSCFMQRADAPVVPYLRKGVRVFVRGNGETRLFSSERDRQLKSGLSINVAEIEIVGGQSANFPSELYTEDGAVVKVCTSYFVGDNVELPASRRLFDRSGNPYLVKEQGFVSREDAPVPASTNSDSSANG